MQCKTNRHSVYCMTYHAVFVIKYRREVITSEMMEHIRKLTERLMKGYGGELLELNGESDHIHILFTVPPQKAPSVIVCSLKTQISKEMRLYFYESFKDKLWKDTFWSESYFIATTGGATIEVLENYIQQQGVAKKKRKYIRKQPSVT